MTVTVTGVVKTVAGVPDRSKWVFASLLRESGDVDNLIVSPNLVVATPNTAGLLTVELDPGPVLVRYGNTYVTVNVPDTGGEIDLWRDLMAVAVTLPPDTADQKIGAAVTAYLDAHPGGAVLELGTTGTTAAAGNDARLSNTRTPTDGTVTTAKIVDANVTLAKLSSGVQTSLGKADTAYQAPAVVGAGADAAAARAAIGVDQRKTYYVSTSGSDSANGLTPATAFATIAKAMSVVTLGSVVLLKRGGTWTPEVDITQHGITLAAYGAGARPIIDRASGAGTVGIWINGANDVTVEDVEVRNVGLAAVELQNALHGTLRRCYLHGSLGHGVIGDGGGYHIIDDCEIAHTGSSATLGTGNGIQFLSTVTGVNIVKDCYVHDIGFNLGDHGIYSEGGVNQYVNNWFDTVVGNGIKVMDASAGTLILRNRITRTQTGGVFVDYANATAAPTLIYHNTLYKAGPQTGGHSPNTGIWLSDYGNAVARNNIIHSSGNGFQLDTNSTLDSDYNCVYAIDVYFGYTRPGGTWTQHATLADWQTATGNEAHSIVTDPLLIDPANVKVNLGTGSPAADAGLLLPTVNDDHLGSAPDLGWNESAAGVDTSSFVTTTGTQTLTNKTLTSPIANAIYDTNTKLLLYLQPNTNAVNYFEVDNAATGGDPAMYGWGSDTNVSLNLGTKGTGIVKANGNPVGVKVAVPSTATSTGVMGQWAADASFFYVCTAANTWRRVAIASW